LGVIKEMLSGDRVTLEMLTGIYADSENNFEFTQDLYKCDKPIESIDDSHRRIAKAIASIEVGEEKKNNTSKNFLKNYTKNIFNPLVVS
jgi:hypothetical protein